jgi:hypothetical protein
MGSAIAAFGSGTLTKRRDGASSPQVYKKSDTLG